MLLPPCLQKDAFSFHKNTKSKAGHFSFFWHIYAQNILIDSLCVKNNVIHIDIAIIPESLWNYTNTTIKQTMECIPQKTDALYSVEYAAWIH